MRMRLALLLVAAVLAACRAAQPPVDVIVRAGLAGTLSEPARPTSRDPVDGAAAAPAPAGSDNAAFADPDARRMLRESAAARPTLSRKPLATLTVNASQGDLWAFQSKTTVEASRQEGEDGSVTRSVGVARGQALAVNGPECWREDCEKPVAQVDTRVVPGESGGSPTLAADALARGSLLSATRTRTTLVEEEGGEVTVQRDGSTAVQRNGCPACSCATLGGSGIAGPLPGGDTPAQQQVTELQAQLASLRDSFESSQAALNSSGQALAQKEADAADLGQRLAAVTSELQAQLDDANAQVQQRTQALEGSQAALAALQAELDGAKQRVAQADGDLAGLQSQLTDANTQLAEKTEALEGAQSDLAATNTDLDNAYGSLSQKQTDLEDMMQQLAEASAQLQTCGEEQAQLATVQFQLAQLQKTCDVSSALLTKAQADLATAQKDKQTALAQLATCQTTSANRLTTINNLRKQVTACTEAKDACASEKGALQQELTACQEGTWLECSGLSTCENRRLTLETLVEQCQNELTDCNRYQASAEQERDACLCEYVYGGC